MTRTAPLILGFGLLAACGGTQYQTLTNPDADLASDATIAFVAEPPPAPFQRVDLPESYRAAARMAVGEELRRLGWRAAPVEEADVIVYASAGRRVDEFRARGQVGTQLSFGTTVTGMDEELDQSAVVFEAFDRSGNEIWYGHAQRTNRSTVDAEEFGEIVERLFADFPRARSNRAKR